MKKTFLFIWIIGQTYLGLAQNEIDTLQNTILENVDVVAEKFQGALYQKKQTLSVTSLNMQQIERTQVSAIKDLSAVIPNLHIPDYGSKMTSSMYVRGMGARIDNPVMGLYVDGVPYFNKNNFDFNFSDIRSIVVMRGPQSSLFGRNTMGGVIDITTLSPLVYQGSRISLGYGNGNSLKFRASTYQKINNQIGVSVAAFANHTDGFYKNTYDNSNCDWINDAGLRLRFQKVYSDIQSIDNSLSVNWVNQGGYPYQHIDATTHQFAPVNYNDRCGYHRLNIHDGLTIQRTYGKCTFNDVIAYQYTDDRMTLDQDFSPKSIFSMQQAQKEHVISQELIGKYTSSHWDALVGTMLFYRHINMNAPVYFKEDGINELILNNANKGIQNFSPGDKILFEETEFPIDSRFKLPSFGAAIYHQSTFRYNAWSLETGIRIDYENASFKYNNNALIHYRFTATMPKFKALLTDKNGREQLDFLELLPRVALNYHIGKFNLFASVSKGYKAGGFNTQLFSDILQNAMMENLMNDLGVHLEQSGLSIYSVADVITYKPEYSWNTEFGFKYIGSRLSAEVTLFNINCRNQQLTVFPTGTATGRMMTNAGRTHNCGVEAELRYEVCPSLILSANYGFTHAIFKQYNNGRTDYADKHIPYAPQHTIAVTADSRFDIAASWLDEIALHMDWKGIGEIYWNEENDYLQPFYGIFNTSVNFRKKHCNLEIWGKNLLEKEYHTFYFVSMNNAFLQHGKTLQCGVSLSFEF